MKQGTKNLLLSVAAGIVLLLALPRPPVAAQVLYGSFFGTVTDSTGAVIPGAQVSVTNDQTGLHREVKTEATGQYRVLDLPDGIYTLTAAAVGFQLFKKTSVALAIGQVEQQDVQLQVGSSTQQVTVQGSTGVLQTQKADVHTEITSYAVAEPSPEHVQEFPSRRNCWRREYSRCLGSPIATRIPSPTHRNVRSRSTQTACRRVQHHARGRRHEHLTSGSPTTC